MLRKYFLLKFISLFLILSGCATIVGDKTQVVGISSSPEEASIVITDENGNTVFNGSTPSFVSLDKSDGSYFGGKTYVITITKEGYEPVSIGVDSKPNGWYIAGNIVFGGLIGWLAVDPFNGAMYSLTPDDISEELVADGSALGSFTDGKTISIVLVENLPTDLREKMIKIN